MRRSRWPSASRSQDGLLQDMLLASADSQCRQPESERSRRRPRSSQSGPPPPEGHPTPGSKVEGGWLSPLRATSGSSAFGRWGMGVCRTGAASSPSALAALQALAAAAWPVGGGWQPPAGGCRWPVATGLSGGPGYVRLLVRRRLPEVRHWRHCRNRLRRKGRSGPPPWGDSKRQRPEPLPLALRRAMFSSLPAGCPFRARSGSRSGLGQAQPRRS